MTNDSGRVHKLETVNDDASAAEAAPEAVAAPSPGVDAAQKDMSKVAIIVSLLAVLLLVIFFFGMNRNIAGLTDEVQSLGVLRQNVSELDQRMVKMQEEVPAEMKRMLALDMVNEMTMKAFHLTDSLQDPEMRTKMGEVLQGLKEVREGLEK